MKELIKHISLIFFTEVLLFISVNAFGLPQGDTITKTIYVTSAILYDSLEVENGAVLSASIQVNDSVNAFGNIEYSQTDSLHVFTLISTTDYALSDFSTSIHFQYQSVGGCISESFNYTFSDSTYDVLYIRSLEFSPHFIDYTDHEVCSGTDSVSLNTNIPTGHVTAFSDSGLVFSDGYSIVPYVSVPGQYTISFMTDYCISENSDTFYFTILEADNLTINVDTLYYCSNGINIGNSVSEYNIIANAAETLSPVINNTVTRSGDYLISLDTMNVCSGVDTVYIQLIDPADIEIESVSSCDRAELSFFNSSNNISSVNWSNGSSDRTTEITNSQWISVEAKDQNGCYSYDSAYVDILPFRLESVDFAKEEATCWKDGSISIAQVATTYGSSGLLYKVVNTLNDQVVNDLSDIPAGRYRIEVSNEDNCIDSLDEKVTILQKCLEDYPVFSPNQDGIEDEYFIPYEGSIKIYDRNGVFQKELDTPAYWDGTDQNGNLMPMGNYVIITDEGRPVNITLVR